MSFEVQFLCPTPKRISFIALKNVRLKHIT